MSSEIIQNVAYDNYDDFQHVNFIYFSQIFISLFWGLFNDEIDLRVRYRWKSCNSGGIFENANKPMLWI